MTERASFEVQVLRDKAWVVAEVKADEGSARAFADNLLNKGNQTAVRVVRDWRRADGLHAETVIVEKAGQAAKGADLSVSAISEAAVCRDIAEIYGPAARATIGRVIRKYLDAAVLTPTELLHSPQELKRFGDKDNLLFTAIDRVSTVQAQALAEESKPRRDFLFSAWDQIVARARPTTPKDLPEPADKTWAALRKAVPKTAKEPDFLATALLARRLSGVRNWLGKLDVLAGWLGEDAALPDAPIIDGAVADLFGSAQLIQDLLGFQNNLGAALMTLVALGEGAAATLPKGAPGQFDTLNRLFAAGLLRESQAALLGRVQREIAGIQPLSRNEPQQEYEVFTKLARCLVTTETVKGGGATADALTGRYARIANLGGAAGIPTMLDGVCTVVSDGCRRVQYLLALLPVARYAAPAEAALTAHIRATDQIARYMPASVPPRDRMAALTATHRAVMQSELSYALKAELGQCIDDTLARYLVDEGVIEKIDRADDPLAVRAIRLVKFCGSGVLIDGKSLNMARQRVIEHLKQRQFEEKFLSSVPDAERHLREFHKLLTESGF